MPNQNENIKQQIISLDTAILELVQKRVSLSLNFKEETAENILPNKKIKNKKVLELNPHIDLIHFGRKIGLRRTLVRKILRSLDQEFQYYTKKNKNNLENN